MRVRSAVVVSVFICSLTLGVWVSFAQPSRLPTKDQDRTMGAAAADAVLEGEIDSSNVRISDFQRQIDDMKEQQAKNTAVITQLVTDNAGTRGEAANNRLWLIILGLVFSAASVYVGVKAHQTAPEIVSEQGSLRQQMRDLNFHLDAFMKLSPSVRMQRELAGELHADNQPVTDRLLERLIAGTLTAQERTALERWLQSYAVARDPSDEKSASNLLDIMKRVENEEKTKLPEEAPKATETGT